MAINNARGRVKRAFSGNIKQDLITKSVYSGTIKQDDPNALKYRVTDSKGFSWTFKSIKSLEVLKAQDKHKGCILIQVP